VHKLKSEILIYSNFAIFRYKSVELRSTLH
jgi:hypothetical protein